MIRPDLRLAAHSTVFPGVAQVERRIWLVTLDIANILVTASRIGSQLTIN